MNITIRKAKRSDGEAFLGLIKELADFEKLDPPDEKAQKRLLKHAFATDPLFYVMMAFDKDAKNKPVGYAIYFFTFSSFLAKPTLYLEDIYISKDYQSQGIGKLFFERLDKVAHKRDCGRMEWAVLDWNEKAIRFYDKLGAKPLKEWIYYRKIL